MVKNGNENSSKNPRKFICSLCDYTSYHRGDLNKHNLTLKHKMITNGNDFITKLPKNKFICSCGKEYKFMSGLSRHKNVCKQSNNDEHCNSDKNTDCLLKIIKSNQELIIQQNKQISELTNNKSPQIINNTQTNIQNNVTFNLNCFLNNTCKDALNMNDFIASIQVTFADLENTGKNEFVKSMTQVITRELGKLDECMRPIHCSDVKRKVLHIKQDNLWKKDSETCETTKLMVRKICHETNVIQIPKWVTANLRSQVYDDKLNDMYFKILGNSMDGNDETYDKIITGISGKIHVGANKHLLL